MLRIPFRTSHCSLGVALHAVVATTESHTNLTLNTDMVYYNLKTAFGGHVIPNLTDLIADIVEKKGYKTFDEISKADNADELDINEIGYAPIDDFKKFADILYLATVASLVGQHFHLMPSDATQEQIGEFILSCANKAAENLIQATRVLNMDTDDYAQMPCILSNEDPLSELRPIFVMIYSSLDPSTLRMIRTAFGAEAVESYVTALNDMNFNLLKASTQFNQANNDYAY